MSFTGEMVIHVLLGFLWWILLLPLIMVASTPVILIVSVKGETTYSERVRRKYATMVEFWKEHGWALIP